MHKKIGAMLLLFLPLVLLNQSILAEDLSTEESNRVESKTDSLEANYILDTEVKWPEINQSIDENTPDSFELNLSEENKLLMNDQIGIIKENANAASIYVQVWKETLANEEDSTTVLPADDLMKLFILAVYYHQLETKELTGNELVQVVETDLIPGSVLANLPLDQAFTYPQLIQLMIQSHDNTACDVLIKQLGGLEKVNQQIKELGFIQTDLVQLMVDEVAGHTNKVNQTSASDVANLLLALYQGVFFNDTLNQSALQMISQHGPIGMAQNVELPAPLYGLKAKSMREGSLNDALLYELEPGVPVVYVLLTEQLADGEYHLANFGEQLHHLMTVEE